MLKTPENRSNIGVRGEIHYFGRSIPKKSEKFIFFLSFTDNLCGFDGLKNIEGCIPTVPDIMKEPTDG